MADAEIKITFPEQKMEALVFFLGEQNEKIENVLKEHLDKTYEKSVPAQVRKFVENRMSLAGADNAQETGEQEATQEQTREPVRRGRRQNARQVAAEVAEMATTENEESQDNNIEADQDSVSTMSMGM